jgi:hypothetical protein
MKESPSLTTRPFSRDWSLEALLTARVSSNAGKLNY